MVVEAQLELTDFAVDKTHRNKAINQDEDLNSPERPANHHELAQSKSNYAQFMNISEQRAMQKSSSRKREPQKRRDVCR